MQNLKRTPTWFVKATFDGPVFFHVVIEILDMFNSVNGPKSFVSHEPMGFLLRQVTELLERGLEKATLYLVDKVQPPNLDHIVVGEGSEGNKEEEGEEGGGGEDRPQDGGRHLVV